MVPLTHFFHLTSAFFGLTSDYKLSLLEEIYICTQHLEGFTYTDVLSLAVYERRFYLNLKTRDLMKKNKQSNEQPKNGSRQSKITGDNLKNRLSSGDIPLN